MTLAIYKLLDVCQTTASGGSIIYELVEGTSAVEGTNTFGIIKYAYPTSDCTGDVTITKGIKNAPTSCGSVGDDETYSADTEPGIYAEVSEIVSIPNRDGAVIR